MRPLLLLLLLRLSLPSSAQDSLAFADSSIFDWIGIGAAANVVSLQSVESRTSDGILFPKVSTLSGELNLNFEVDRWRPSIGLRITQVPLYLHLSNELLREIGWTNTSDQNVSFRYIGSAYVELNVMIFYTHPLGSDWSAVVGTGIAHGTHAMRRLADKRSFYLREDQSDAESPNLFEAHYLLPEAQVGESFLFVAGVQKELKNGHRWCYQFIGNYSRNLLTATSISYASPQGRRSEVVFQTLTFIGIRLEYLFSS